MALHILNPNVNDFLNHLDTYIHELLEVQYNTLQDLSCIVLHGNDDIYLETYAREMIKQYFKLDSLPMQMNQDEKDETVSTYSSSAYHFEMDYTVAHNSLIKQIIKNKNIANRKYIFVLKKFITSHKQYQLKNLIDSGNAIFIIIAKTSNNLDQGIISRATMLRLSFKPQKIREFVKQHYNIEMEPNTDHSILSIIAGVGTPKYERDLYALMDVIVKSRNQMDIVKGIKEYCYKVFHICIPLSVLCKIIIKKYIKHAKLRELIEVCSICEHTMITGTRDILCYEQLFTNIWEVMRA